MIGGVRHGGRPFLCARGAGLTHPRRKHKNPARMRRPDEQAKKEAHPVPYRMVH